MLPPGQRPSGPAAATGLDFRIIPAGVNPLRQRLRGECPAGISNGVNQTLAQRGTAVKSMSSPGSIQGLPLESIPKRLETAFLWEHTFDSIASLCNNGVKYFFLRILLLRRTKWGMKNIQ